MKAKPSVEKGPKIIVQYWTKSGKTYELQNASTVIALHVTLEDGPGVTAPWHMQARSTKEQESPPVDGWGATPGDALHDLVRAWNEHDQRLVAFDWESAAKELRVVRAI